MLQPLAVDWREKMKTTKAAAAVKRKPAATTPVPVTYNEKPDLEALSVGLPADWKALWDKTSKEVYYANPKTKVGMPNFPPSAACGEWDPFARRQCAVASRSS